MIFNTTNQNQTNFLNNLTKHDFLTTKELAGILKCNERTIIRWRRAREQGEEVGIPFTKIEKKYIYFPQDVVAYLEKGRV